MRAVLVGLLVAAVCAGAAAVSTSTPGGLSREQTPQFILLTHDDAITSDTASLMTSVTDGRSANGCPLTATMFVLERDTDCDKLKELYDRGYEIADHTLSHDSLNDMGKSEIEEEIVGARSAIASSCGIPEGDIRGFRAPYLDTKPEVREVLSESGFLYDSTLIENTKGHSVSSDFGNRVWPWNMGEGIGICCECYSPAQTCDDGESYPGLWQVPIWDLSASGGTYTMDPGGEDGEGDVYNILVDNFEAAYNGNRAPFPIFIHTPWLQGAQSDLADFVDYAASKPGVYFVTIQQLLAWMNDPTPLESLSPSSLGCGNAGGSPGSGGGGSYTPPAGDANDDADDDDEEVVQEEQEEVTDEEVEGSDVTVDEDIQQGEGDAEDDEEQVQEGEDKQDDEDGEGDEEEKKKDDKEDKKDWKEEESEDDKAGDEGDEGDDTS